MPGLIVIAVLVAGVIVALASGRLRGRDGSETSREQQPLLFWLGVAIMLFCIAVSVWQFGQPRHHVVMPPVQPSPLQQADQAR